jgi:hypothetical protein
MALLERILLHAGLSGPATPLPSFLNAKGPAEGLLAVVLVTVVALAEETIFRAYLCSASCPFCGARRLRCCSARRSSLSGMATKDQLAL